MWLCVAGPGHLPRSGTSACLVLNAGIFLFSGGWKSRCSTGAREAPPTNPYSKLPFWGQHQSKESRQRGTITLLHLSSTWLEPASDHWGYWEHSRSQQLNREVWRAATPHHITAHSHLSVLSLKHSEFSACESRREMVLGVVEPSAK